MELQEIQREVSKLAMDIAVLKSREETYKAMPMVAIALNALTVCALICLIVRN